MSETRSERERVADCICPDRDGVRCANARRDTIPCPCECHAALTPPEEPEGERVEGWVEKENGCFVWWSDGWFRSFSVEPSDDARRATLIIHDTPPDSAESPGPDVAQDEDRVEGGSGGDEKGGVRCYDCGRLYGAEHGFPDLVVPDDVWRKISPSGGHSGLLCPSCMVARAYKAGIEGVPARFTSGPFDPKTPTDEDDGALVDEIERRILRYGHRLVAAVETGEELPGPQRARPLGKKILALSRTQHQQRELQRCPKCDGPAPLPNDKCLEQNCPMPHAKYPSPLAVIERRTQQREPDGWIGEYEASVVRKLSGDAFRTLDVVGSPASDVAVPIYIGPHPTEGGEGE